MELHVRIGINWHATDVLWREHILFLERYENDTINIYRTLILPVVLYGCETWSLTLRQECRLKMFENSVLMGIFGAVKDEVRGEWRKLHNEELKDLYCSPSIVRVIKSRGI